MPVLSYLHQLFNADQCYAYIHTLRWKDRPLQCPRGRHPNSRLTCETRGEPDVKTQRS
jgi:hypothetical protein